MTVEQKLNKMGFTLPEPPQRGGVYIPIKKFGGKFAYASGFGPAMENASFPLGKLGKEVSLEEGRKAAQLCVLNLLAALKSTVGDLDRVKSFVKILAFVSSESDFYQQPQVANGASQLLCDLFGEDAGLAARSAIGVNVLPGNIPVEVEALIELKD